MGFLRRSKDSVDQRPSDGPEEWHRKALEKDAEVMRERAERLGDTAVSSGHDSGEHHERQGFTRVEELSEDFLRKLYGMRVRNGKFVRIGNRIFVSPGARPGFAEHGLMHKDILQKALEKDSSSERAIDAEALHGAPEVTIGPDGLVDAGKFDIYFVPDDEPREDELKGRFRVFGSSASYGMAEQSGREKTVEIASETLGPDMRVEDAPHMMFSR